MKDFHSFVRQLLLAWLALYGMFLLVALAKPLGLFAIAAFDFTPTSYQELVNALRTAAWWLIPTGFLTLAFTLSAPRWKT
jgi:hypothetical protein